MKNSIKYASLVSAMVLGLSACGGGGGSDTGATSSTSGESFVGTWKGGCEASGNKSAKQTWELKADGSLTNTIPVWDQANDCTGRKRGPAVVTAKLEYKNEVDVGNTCKGGKARQVNIELLKLDTRSLGIHEGDSTIRALLASSVGGGITFPKYDIICIGDDGKLHTGNVDGANDGSTEEKRPTEVNPTKAFSK